MTVRVLPRGHRAPVAVALSLVLGLSALASCGTEEASPEDPQTVLADAVDQVYEDATGHYEVEADLGDEVLREEGDYEVTPDMARVERSSDGDADGAGRFVLRYLRRGDETWVEVQGPRGGSVRTGCYVHGDIREVSKSAKILDTGLALSSPAVEVVLGLRKGRMKGDELVAQAALKTLAAVLGFKVARRLDIPGKRIDVPVRVDLEDGRIVGWEASLADVLDAAPGSDDVDIDPDEVGDITATLSDPGEEVDLTAPDDDMVVEAEKGSQAFFDFVDECAADGT